MWILPCGILYFALRYLLPWIPSGCSQTLQASCVNKRNIAGIFVSFLSSFCYIIIISIVIGNKHHWSIYECLHDKANWYVVGKVYHITRVFKPQYAALAQRDSVMSRHLSQANNVSQVCATQPNHILIVGCRSPDFQQGPVLDPNLDII